MTALRNTMINPVLRRSGLFTILFVTFLICAAVVNPIEAAGISIPMDTPLDLSDGISAQEAVVLAIRENYSLVALSKAREAALGGVSRAKSFAEPEIRLGASGLDDSWINSQTPDYGLALRWTPPRLGERGLKGDVAMGQVFETEGAIAVSEDKLASDILVLHMEIVFLDEKIALAETAVKIHEAILEFVDNQVRAEVKTLMDRNIADLTLVDARLIPDTYRAQRLICINRLAGELNLSGADLKIQKDADALDLKPRSLDLPILIGTAMTNRPELSIASVRVAEAETTLRLNKIERYPWFSYFQTGPQFDAGHSSHSFGLRFGIEIPIFKWNSDFLRKPSAEVQKSQLDLTALKRQIRMQVEQTATQLQARYKALEYFDKMIAPILACDLTLAEQSVALKQTDGLQFLLAQAQGLQRRQAYLTDLLECRRLEIELERVTGSIIDRKSKRDPR
jgi:outer membrane protein TolC